MSSGVLEKLFGHYLFDEDQLKVCHKGFMQYKSLHSACLCACARCQNFYS